MDGEFVCRDFFGTIKGVAGGNFLRIVYEIVIDGIDLPSVEEATRVGRRAACSAGVLRISAGNYGGKLGPFHLHLHKLLGP